LRVAALALLCGGLLLAGCSGSSRVERRIPGLTLRIYMSGPLSGASSLEARAAMTGAEMALMSHGARIGRYRIALEVLDDATPQAGGWDPSRTSADARAAAQDPATVGYIGDFDSGASAISIPVLNRAGIAQISPQGGAVGLTSAAPGASPGEPGKYYPTGRRTFARVVPNDAVEARAEVALQKSLGCQAPLVLEDGEVDGDDAAISYALAARAAGLHVLAVQSYPRGAADYISLARGVARSGADCLLLEASDEHSAARVAAQIGRWAPAVRIFASSGLADAAFADPALGGVPDWLDARVLVLSPGLSARQYPPAGRWFLAAYARLYGPPPPQAIFGYEAMSLMLSAIAQASDDGRRAVQRAQVTAKILGARRRHSVLGSYTIGHDGDTSIRRYGVWRLSGGRLVFLEPQSG
jgi:branched-chain amino acid transport system substrate-binding protein